MSTGEGSLSGRQPKAVQSALRVLEEVARTGVGVTAKEIAQNLGLPSATTYRLLNLLVAEGYIVRLPDLSGFSLGHRMSKMIDAAVAPRVCTAAREVLAEFPPPADESVLNHHLYACAVGKLLLAEKGDAGDLIPAALAPLTDRTVRSRADLFEHLRAVRTEGFAAQTGELRNETACVAVPVRALSGTLVAALAMSGRADQDALLRSKSSHSPGVPSG